MPYTLLIDSPENFECSLQLEGASLSKSFARLVIETNSLPFAMVFNGTIGSNGKCTIPIAKLKDYLAEDCNGSMVLEVVADSDTYFEAWRDSFSAKVSKKVVVTEVKNSTPTTTEPQIKKPRIVVSEVNTKSANVDELGKKLGVLLSSYGVTIHNVSKSQKIIESFLIQNKQHISQESLPNVIESALQHLSVN